MEAVKPDIGNGAFRLLSFWATLSSIRYFNPLPSMFVIMPTQIILATEKDRSKSLPREMLWVRGVSLSDNQGGLREEPKPS
jgi:hypothetical protein